MYKFKKFGHEMIIDANTRFRINCLQQIDAFKSQGDVDNPQDGGPAAVPAEKQSVIREISKKYSDSLSGEVQTLNEFTQLLQDCTFDYFNLILKEYMIALDKWGADEDYCTKIKEEYARIDKDLEDEEMSYPIPEKLTKELAQQLFDEKEKQLSSVYQQLVAKLKSLHGQE